MPSLNKFQRSLLSNSRPKVLNFTCTLIFDTCYHCPEKDAILLVIIEQVSTKMPSSWYITGPCSAPIKNLPSIVELVQT